MKVLRVAFTGVLAAIFGYLAFNPQSAVKLLSSWGYSITMFGTVWALIYMAKCFSKETWHGRPLQYNDLKLNRRYLVASFGRNNGHLIILNCGGERDCIWRYFDWAMQLRPETTHIYRRKKADGLDEIVQVSCEKEL